MERVVPITLTNIREGRSRSRDKANNPFLEPSGLSTRPGDDKAAEAKLPATKIAPLATAEVTPHPPSSNIFCFTLRLSRAKLSVSS